jgi:hypothetical protein
MLCEISRVKLIFKKTMNHIIQLFIKKKYRYDQYQCFLRDGVLHAFIVLLIDMFKR